MRFSRISVLVACCVSSRRSAPRSRPRSSATASRRHKSGAAGRLRHRHRSGNRPPGGDAITNERGEYRLRNLPPGKYTVQAELSGFSTVVLRDVELLVGRTRRFPFTMKVAQVSETLTVIGETPLVDTASSQVAGQRRSPADGAVAAPGPQLDGAVEAGERHHRERRGNSRASGKTHVSAQPRRSADHPEGRRLGIRPAALQPRVDRRVPDRDQHVRCDARPIGRNRDACDHAIRDQQNSGSVYGFFRNDKLNAKDAVANKVLPYQNQQVVVPSAVRS